MIVRAVGGAFLLVLMVWAAGALWFDLPLAAFRVPAVAALLLIAAFALWRGRLWWLLAACLLVVGWWLTLPAKQERPWQPDVDRTAWAEIADDQVTLHNVRNCDYRTEHHYTPRWETRTVRLSQLTGLDLAICQWGSPYMAHPIASFQFAEAAPVCFSIETRKETGESYSAIGGFYRQYELIYVVADERDVLRLRTNYRKDEEVYLYRSTVSADAARQRFLEYIRALNTLHARPRWYNAATTNCTTSVRTQRAAADRMPWDWRLLVNGKMDELLYERGALNIGGLTFSELRKQALINPPARAADQASDFSRRIREGRASF